ncbi:MAG: AAA family ATPase [Hadesarchaea archaeon]|nr:AAA family ATPase [Hadesarchaea archaeon]
MPHINKIELRGFKSFGNAKVTVPLSRGLTAIVGPNGMGKSNIIDALCFVLGWMSAKTMRAERFSDLLFNGGNGGRPASFAEVSLYFDNSDGGLQINSKEVIITRQLHRDGTCTYRINHRRATREEIIDLLAPKMTCPGGYNFVLQGEVNRFFNMDPVERRRIIDDLAGVAEYDEKKQKSLNELQKVEANLKNVEAVLAEISGQMENLRGQMETAIYFKQLKREHEQIQGALLLIKKKKCSGAIEQLDAKISKLTGEIEELKKRHQKTLEEKDKLNAKIDGISKSIDEKRASEVLVEAERARTEINTLNDILKRTSERKLALDQEIELLAEKIKKISDSRTTDGETLESMVFKFNDARNKFLELYRSLVKCESLSSAKNILKQISEVLNEISGIMEKISDGVDPQKIKQIDSARADERKLREEMAGLQRTRNELARQMKELSMKIQEVKVKLKAADYQEKEIRNSIESLASERNALRQKLESITKRERELETRIRNMEGDLQRLQIQRDALNNELKEINTNLKKVGEVNLPKNVDAEALEKRAQQIEAELGTLSERVNFRAVQDFRESQRRYNEEKMKHDKLIAEKQSLLSFMAEIDEKKKQVFMKTFDEISKQFTQIFKQLSPKGDAMLKLENEESPFEGGLEIIARPEGSGAAYIGSLSGGQKALTALAFIFALQRYRPSTFYVLDEIDAHLDPKNRTKVAEMLRQFSRDSQIVVVTLHDSIMSVADRLFGVTKENGISRIYSVELSGVGS